MTLNKDAKGAIDTSVNRRSLCSRILKYLFIGMGSFIFLLLAFAAWIYFSLIAGPSIMDISDYHPFKSSEAKIRYLAFEDKMAKKWPIISEEKTVRTSYGQTFMRISGPVNGQPLVLLPGGGSNSLIWQANIKALSSVYRTYALDNIYDFGRSVYTREMKTPNDFSQWLDELFDTLSLGKNIRIAGYSYGGWVTGIYATSHPERLSRVILIAPPFLIQPITNDFIWNMIIGILPCKYTMRRSLYSAWNDLAKSGKEGKEIVDDRVEYVYIAMKSFKFKTGVEPIMLTDADLNKLTMPVLFLIGEHEIVCNPQLAINRLNKVAPGIKTELISGTGHDLMFTHTDKVNNAMLDFLK
jgi:pimeloyl-ACP methyl ester carboxylesterase